MAAPLAGKADAPDVPASPMPAATKLANKIVRIVTSPSLPGSITFFLDHQSAPPGCGLLMSFAGVNLPFINLPFINLPFINLPFINLPFINLSFR